MLESVRDEWRCFRDDPPGHRFLNHHLRAHAQKTRTKSLVRISIGAVLVAGGVVLLFIPGPGLLLILFGVALFAGESSRLATLLDRAEPPLRARGHEAADRWRHASTVARITLVGVAALAVVAAGLLGWNWFIQ